MLKGNSSAVVPGNVVSNAPQFIQAATLLRKEGEMSVVLGEAYNHLSEVCLMLFGALPSSDEPPTIPATNDCLELRQYINLRTARDIQDLAWHIRQQTAE